MSDNVIPLKFPQKEDDKKDENTDFGALEIKNKANAERVAKEQLKANKDVLRTYHIKHKI